MFLTKAMKKQKLDVLALAHEMGYRTLGAASRWCDGSSIPHAYQLAQLATVLDEDPVTVSVTWLAAQCRELEEVLNNEVLIPRGSNLPYLL
jgi:transcriptional regulator with XRE-family HTH domain